MSLIGDALKKAHLEAVQQDGGSVRLRHTPGVAQFRPYQKTKSRRLALALVISNVFLVLLVAGFAFWAWKQGFWGANEPAGVASMETTATVPVTATEPQQQPEPVSSAPDPVAAAAPAPSVTPSPAPKPASVTAAPAPAAHAASREEPAQIATVEAAPEPRSPRQTSSGRNGLIDGQTYMRSVPVPGGSEILLNGLSVAGGRGVALINGRMVREGDRVGPFTVGSIADRRVQLHYEDISIYLRLP